MEDTNSIASFEDIAPSTHHCVRDASVVDTSSSVDLVDEDVPDICYVLQYKELGKGLVEVRRGPKPIDPDLGENLDGKAEGDKKKKPVLEIVTVVSTSLVSSAPNYDDYPPPPHHYMPRYGGHRPYEPPRPRFEEETGMDVAKSVNTVMVIRSRHLINALAAVVGYYPGTSFTGDEVKIEAPYAVLIHHRAALLRYKTRQPETHDEEYASTTSKHIDILVGFLEQKYGQQIREEGYRHARKIPTVTYEWLWLLFRPGEVIYTRHDNAWSPFVISRVTKKITTNADGLCSYSIDCWNYMYLDGKLRRRMHTFDINPFSGDEAIHNLPVIPARFFTGEDKNMSPSEVTAEQIRLGKLVWELYKKPSYKSYDGDLAKKSPSRFNDNGACPAGYISGRIIVDGEGYERNWQNCPIRGRRCYPYSDNGAPPPAPTCFDQLPYLASYCGCRACSKREGSDELSSFSVFQDLDPKMDKAPQTDLYYQVISKVIAGFILDERRWGHFYVEKLRDIKFDKEAFKYLVLDYEIKSTVKSLIGKFASADGHVSAWPKDFVKNKGQGRIFLLHGSPGVGKTCTAECVAELTHRPLLALTSGDLSTEAHMVETNLEYFLSLGERFGAIVLLDEADVYLESRRLRDIERNGLVSVFLRALEYYRGVLFLTTNRVQTFDDAFTSRIHVALHYGALTDTDRERIWMHSFERLERDAGGRVHVAVTAREYAWQSADVRSLRWNGREIRNALQTAVALAETDALDDGADVVMLTDKHLRSVVRMSRGFKSFMRHRRPRSVERDDDIVIRGEEEEEAEVAIYDDEDDGESPHEADNAEFSGSEEDVRRSRY
ncbi:P-loop containing nucleoside triphosphate hydrolase protein [Xylaria sp. FL0933]|nr:P-loop containing nucleoside triphosphate hydrolase protein [Xylaria sp. FL0933]